MRTIAPEIFSRTIVKPSSSGINHPTTHTLSFFDKTQLRSYVPIVYFYANSNEPGTNYSARSDALKKSLSAALSMYYQLAGRSNSDNVSIDCNDEGVLFLEARIGCSFSEVLSDSALRGDTVNLFFPDGLHYQLTNSGGPLVVQVTYFDCGGMAIAICFCHSILDLSSFGYFFNDWASLTCHSGNPEVIINPEFSFGTLYPPNDLLEVKERIDKYMQQFADKFMQVKCVRRRFLFDYAKIAKLKELVAKEAVENLSRVEVVTAFIFRCAVSAAARARSSSGLIKPAAMRLPVNLRTRVCSPFSERTMGNFLGSIRVAFSGEEIDKLKWHQIAAKIRNEKNKYFDECARKTSSKALCSFVSEGSIWMENLGDDQDVYFYSSWCGFPLYDADFGWGKPDLVTTGRPAAMKNWIHMTDTSRGGIEVLVSLEEQDMFLFESDEELLAYATV